MDVIKPQVHAVRKSQKKSHSELRAKRASYFTALSDLIPKHTKLGQTWLSKCIFILGIDLEGVTALTAPRKPQEVTKDYVQLFGSKCDETQFGYVNFEMHQFWGQNMLVKNYKILPVTTEKPCMECDVLDWQGMCPDLGLFFPQLTSMKCINNAPIHLVAIKKTIWCCELLESLPTPFLLFAPTWIWYRDGLWQLVLVLPEKSFLVFHR